jgi:hypothetical protein
MHESPWVGVEVCPCMSLLVVSSGLRIVGDISEVSSGKEGYVGGGGEERDLDV